MSKSSIQIINSKSFKKNKQKKSTRICNNKSCANSGGRKINDDSGRNSDGRSAGEPSAPFPRTTWGYAFWRWLSSPDLKCANLCSHTRLESPCRERAGPGIHNWKVSPSPSRKKAFSIFSPFGKNVNKIICKIKENKKHLLPLILHIKFPDRENLAIFHY